MRGAVLRRPSVPLRAETSLKLRSSGLRLLQRSEGGQAVPVAISNVQTNIRNADSLAVPKSDQAVGGVRTNSANKASIHNSDFALRDLT